LTRAAKTLRRLGHPEPRTLLLAWCKIIEEDNRRGVLAGTDKHGDPMAPVTYRPVHGKGTKANARQKNHPKKGARSGTSAGFGPHVSGLHNNLTHAEYERLNGPPLAPRGAFSRVVTNLRTRFGRLASLSWQAVGYWDEVVSTKGVPFLLAHFTGARTGKGGKTRLPRRDLRGVRPEGERRARVALRAWIRSVLRGGYTGG
jgi:hypothetical protein